MAANSDGEQSDNKEVIDTSNMSEGKAAALQMAEAARQQQWDKASFSKDLFMGKVDMSLIHPFPLQPSEDLAAGKTFLDQFKSLLKDRVDPDQIDRDGEIPDEIIEELISIGAFGIKVPTEYGGLGLSQTNYLHAASLMGSHCANVTVLLSAHQSIGVSQPLLLFGTEEQKKKYLPRVAKDEISAFALTEVGVGSDPAKMETSIEPSDDGEHFIINGEKLWCTNGTRAGVIVVMGRTPDREIKGKMRRQISAFILEMDTPGITVKHRCRFMGLRSIYNAVLQFDNVKVPRENLIGEEGRGLKVALATLNTGRLTVAGACVGISKQCLALSGAWARQRVQWGGPIAGHSAIADKIGKMAADIFAMEALVTLTGRLVDMKKADIRLESAMSKMKATEDACRIIDECMQIRGGRGYETAESLEARGEKGVSIERSMRDARINTIFEGSSEIMRLIIARDAMDPHLTVAGDVLNSKLGMGTRFKAAIKAGFFYMFWYPKTFLPFGARGTGGLHPRLKRQVNKSARISRRLARGLFHAMARFGPKLEREHMLLKRFVDIGTEVCVMCAVCSYAQSLYAKDKNTEYIDLAELYCKEAALKVREYFAGVSHNNDAQLYKMARRVMEEGKFEWLSSGIVEADYSDLMGADYFGKDAEG